MHAGSSALRSILGSLFVVAIAGTAGARPPEGGYFGFGLGYGIVSGERGVPLKPSSKFSLNLLEGTEAYKETVRSDFGAGMSVEVRFGWLIGPIAPEIVMFGHGTFDFENGAGYPMLQVRFHPLMLVDSMVDAKVDGSVYVGAGYAIGGYHHEGDDDGKGWEGWVLAFGLGGTYELSERIRLGVDVKFALPMYSSWIFSRDDDITFEPESTPSTLVIAPSLQIIASF